MYNLNKRYLRVTKIVWKLGYLALILFVEFPLPHLTDYRNENQSPIENAHKKTIYYLISNFLN